MLSLLFCVSLLAAPQGSTSIVINEFSYDDSGTDDREYVELHNPTKTDVDISGWVLEATDTATPDNNADYTIPANTILKAGAYYVLGSALVDNVDQVVGTTNLWENSNESLSIRDKTGKIIDTVVYESWRGWPATKSASKEGEGVWGNFAGIHSASRYYAMLLGKNEQINPVNTAATGRAVLKFDATTRQVDIRVVTQGMVATGAHLHLGSKNVNGPVIVGLTKSGNAWVGSGTLTVAQATAFSAGDTYINVHSAKHPGGEIRGQALQTVSTSWSRHSGDTDDNGRDFHLLPSTPGMSNALFETLPYNDNFDARADEEELDAFVGSFAFAHVIDPTKVSASNPAAIPASPQGGKAAVFWDSSGGGNTNVLLAPTTGNAVFEAYAYLDTKVLAATFHESWSIGFGSTGTFYNAPDPGGTLSFTANGNTGITWTYQNLPSGPVLYLIDHNNGGNGANATTTAKILATIKITKANGGWQRLRLEVNGKTGVASFGGTLGCADGTNYGFELEDDGTTRCFYIGFREFVLDRLTERPVTLDALSIHTSTSSTTAFGTAKATTKGTPKIDVGSPPTIGNSKFSIELSGLVPSGGSLLVFGAKLANPLDMTRLGGQTGSFLYVAPSFVLGFGSDAKGEASLVIPIPCDKGLLGASISWQDLDLDPALTVAFKVGNSAAIETKVGN